MRILFYGDSITDAGRDFQNNMGPLSYGNGYVRDVVELLEKKDPEKYEVINRGISGNRVVDLYARVKVDCWNLEPDVLSILIGVNDVWHEFDAKNGVELERWEKVYRMLIEDTLARLPNVKLILCEPFLLSGTATAGNLVFFDQVAAYAQTAKKLAEEYGLYFLSLQEPLDALAVKHGPEQCLSDGVHPMPLGAKLIASEWVKLFENEIDK